MLVAGPSFPEEDLEEEHEEEKVAKVEKPQTWRIEHPPAIGASHQSHLVKDAVTGRCIKRNSGEGNEL